MADELEFESAIRRRLGSIQKLGDNKRIQQIPKKQMEGIPNNGAMPRFSPSIGKGGNDFERFIQAISGQESGGRYNAMGINVNGDRAHGKYQIMGRNIPGWSRQALGRSVSPQEFLRNPQIQEAVARHQLQNYYRKYGAEGAAVAWYSGEGNAKKYMRNRGGYNRRQNGGRFPSINSYAQAILRRMGQG